MLETINIFKNIPNVELVWNYWPFTIVFISPLRAVMNFVFFLPWVITVPLETIWNVPFEFG